MPLRKYNGDEEISKLFKRHLGCDPSDRDVILGYYISGKLNGYVVYSDTETIFIEWIYAMNSTGKAFMKLLEKRFSKRRIVLKMSVDPTEDKVKVMKRLNFYIGLQYRVTDIVFRKKYGPLVTMEKRLN
jgi:hypothetical protein